MIKIVIKNSGINEIVICNNNKNLEVESDNVDLKLLK